jgi:putative ABC transport system permease protein
VVRVATRASRDGLAPILARLQQEIARLDPELPAHNLKTLREHLAIALVPVIVGASVLGLFGGLALLLACVGLYGLLASAVAHRTHEIGIRRALGARDRDVFGLVVRQSMAPVLAGLGGGLGLGLLASPVMRTLLHGIGPDDPVAYGGAVLVLLFTAAVACGLPASRATRVEPMKLLREE